MKYELLTDITINAPADRVWSLLTDFSSYPSWNPFVRRIEGKLALGERLKIEVQPAGGRPMKFSPRVTVCEPGARFAWLGNLIIPGLFDGEHRFEVHAAGAQTKLVHAERFGGMLVRLLKSNLDGPVKRGFVAMNEAVKQRCES